MKRRVNIKRGLRGALAAGFLVQLGACSSTLALNHTVDQFNALRDRYLLTVLERNPVTSMYFGGSGFGQAFRGINGRLRDYRPEAISEEVEFFREIQRARNAIRPEWLPPHDRNDHAVLGAQINFILYQLESVRYYERCVDTYVEEPYRGIQWQVQQMQEAGEGLRGTEEEWDLVLARVAAIPGYLEAARTNLSKGKAAGNLPPSPAVERYGIEGSRTNAEYFRSVLPGMARRYVGERAFAEQFLSDLDRATEAAGMAYSAFAAFIDQTYRGNDAQDLYVMADHLSRDGLLARRAGDEHRVLDLAARIVSHRYGE